MLHNDAIATQLCPVNNRLATVRNTLLGLLLYIDAVLTNKLLHLCVVVWYLYCINWCNLLFGRMIRRNNKGCNGMNPPPIAEVRRNEVLKARWMLHHAFRTLLGHMTSLETTGTRHGRRKRTRSGVLYSTTSPLLTNCARHSKVSLAFKKLIEILQFFVSLPRFSPKHPTKIDVVLVQQRTM